MRWIAGIVAAAIVVAGIVLLRAETMSTHTASLPGSLTHVIVEVDTKNRELSSTRREMVQALILTCRLEVDADLRSRGVPETHDDGYRFTLTPALDKSDRLQLRGCLEDMRIDHLQAEVVRMEDGVPEHIRS